MRFALTLAAGLTAAGPALAQPVELPRGLIVFGEVVARSVMETLVMAARSQVELIYDDILVDLAAGRIALTGLHLRPDLPWDEGRACQIHVDQIEVLSSQSYGFGEARIDLTGLEAPLDCMPEEPRGVLTATGYDRVRAETLAIDYGFDVASSALNVSIAGAVENAVEIEAEFDFSYFWVQTPISPDGEPSAEPQPVIDLAFAEVAIADMGLMERAGPQLEGMFGGFAAIPPMLEGMIVGILGDGGAPEAAAARFGADARAAAENFLAGEGRIVLTAEPEEPLRLEEGLGRDPGLLFAALSPHVSGDVAARGALVPAELLLASLRGGDLSDASRLLVGEALATGVGAPYAPALARQALAPMVEAWDGEAALIASLSHGDEGGEEAYALALIAASAGLPDGRTRLNRLEALLPLPAILGAQSAAAEAWPGGADADEAVRAAIDAGDLAALRAEAAAWERGADRPRAYARAYQIAALAAAGGDRAGATIRARIDARLSRRGAGADTWAETREALGEEAINIWLEGGLAERLAR